MVNIMTRQIILDTETTGVDAKVDRIVEFAAYELVNRQPTGNMLHVYINPQRSIDPDAEAVHGLSRTFLEQYGVFKDEAQKIIDFISGSELIIHNAPFDVGFLNEEFKRNGFQERVENICSITDTLTMARNKFPGKKNSLDALCDRFDVSRENRVLHGALIDCELLSKVYLRMTMEQYGLAMVIDHKEEAFLWEKQPLPVVQVNQEDVATHQKYMEGIKNNLWSLYQ